VDKSRLYTSNTSKYIDK